MPRGCVLILDQTEFYLWLIAQHVNAHLRWLVIWLTGALGAVNILVQVSIRVNSSFQRKQLFVIWFVYGLILGGMSFSVYRLTNITGKQMRWNRDLNRSLLDNSTLPTNEIFADRGRISEFFVSDEGNPRNYNMGSFIIFQDIVLIFLLLIILHFQILVSLWSKLKKILQN